VVFPFQLHPRPELLERHARQGTGPRTLTTKIIGALTRRDPTGATASPLEHAPEQGYEQLPEPLSQAECCVLSLLQTSLSAPEIARELYVSVNTVRTHTGTCTTSSAPIAAWRPSTGPVPSDCSHPRCSGR
jgi:LuxR family transcriptional regulator, maltose regulon positive regulatory protein